MLQPEEILLEVKRLSKIAMDYEQKNTVAKLGNLPFGYDEHRRIPDYYPGYRLAVENYEAILAHADKNVFPYSLFAKRAPNQTEKMAHWLRENYKNVTQSVYLDFKNTILRCTDDSLWSVDYGDESQDIVSSGMTFQKYVEKEIKGYNSVETFFKDILFDVKLKDAMGVIAVKPHYIPTYLNTEGELVMSSVDLPEPVPYYYTCKQVVKFESGAYAFIELHERTRLKYGNSFDEIGRVYEVYDDQNIWRVTQIGKYIDNEFRIDLYYNHGEGKLPVERLKGVSQIVYGHLIYDSPFLFGVDHLDLVAQNSSYKQASIAKCVFPATVMQGNVCDFEDERGACIEGYIAFFDDNLGKSVRTICPECNGIGLKSRMGAMETLLIKPKVRGQEEESYPSGTKPLEYVSPEVHTLEFLAEDIERHEKKARQILHLHTSNSDFKGKEDLTATGMALDMKATHAFIMPIAYQAFELYEFILRTIGWQRYGERFNPPVVTAPQTIEIGTSGDMLALINEMNKNEMPPILIQSEVYRYLKAQFYTDKVTSQVYQLIIDTDRLLTMSSVDIQLSEKNGKVAKWESILHDSALTFIQELLQDDPKFFDKDIQVQKDSLIEKAKNKLTEIEAENPGVPSLTDM